MASKKNSQKNKLIILCLLISMLLCGFSFLFLYRSYQSKQRIDELNETIKEQELLIKELQQGQSELPMEPVKDEEIDNSAEPADTSDSVIKVGELSAGMEVSATDIDFVKVGQYFQGYEISGDIFTRINDKSFQISGEVTLDDLRYLKVLHYDFENKIRVGELIVATDLMDDYLNIFRRLFESKYQINSMFLVDDFWTGDPDTTDSASIEMNNTSAFNYRMATGSSTLSKHAFGRAIDINPQQNPYVSYNSGSAKWYHDNANGYIDRTTGAAHMINESDLCYQLFLEYGFEWGGHWDIIKDYQHFEKH